MGQKCSNGVNKSFDEIITAHKAASPKRSKVYKADFPEAPVVTPSEASQQDLLHIKLWPKLSPLTAEEIVVVKGAWNRIIAWKDMLMEAMIFQWVYLDGEVHGVIEACLDEIQHDLFQVIDRSVRALDRSTEVHHRESYTEGFPACVTRNFGQEPFEILTHYAILGVRPAQWATLKQAFLFAMKTHNPYMYEHDKRDLDRGQSGALARFFHMHVVQEANTAILKVMEQLQGPACRMIHRQVLAIGDFEGIGSFFYKTLLTMHPSMLDFFAKTDMKTLAKHLEQTISMLGSSQIRLRDLTPMLRRLGEVHRVAMIPTEAFPLLAEVLIATLDTVVEMDKETVQMWQFLYVAASRIISLPMAVEERIYEEACEFFEKLAKDENWSHVQLEKRLYSVHLELSLTGTYRHTAHEIEAGARMAWRNAPKCIGRIAWNTLMVRDCRHVCTPTEIFEECQEHLRLATCKETIQSVMTVFAPRKVNQMWGTRFWNAQLVRFAGYEQKDGTVLGDPANVEFTKLVMERFDWKPPAKRTPFDPLPQIIQVDDHEPEMFEFPPELMHRVKLEHPTFKGFAGLGLQWCAVPCITNFNMKIGGLNYPCCPFNGWFVDLEIARNLFERYKVAPAVAKVCGVDATADARNWRQICYAHLCTAVTHSFRKAKISIVDHYTVSNQFLTHVDREMQAGREVPAQWSWIGGFAGVHCPVWGYEMRDFYLRPQFHYCAERYVVEDFSRNGKRMATSLRRSRSLVAGRRVLILYASETGTAERFAKRMAHELGPGYRPRIMELNALTEASLTGTTHVLFFCSTFNNGQAPANGCEFPDVLPFAFTQENGAPIQFAVMALGSTIYPQFCAFGKKVEKVVRAAGAKSFVSTVLADETKDQQFAFTQFVACVHTELPPCHSASDVPIVLKVSLSEPMKPEQQTPRNEISGHKAAKVVSSRQLLDDASESRSTRLIQIDISGTGMEYHTGDHLSVFPCNPDKEVELLCDALGIPRGELHAKVTVEMDEDGRRYPAALHFEPTTLYEMLKWHFDISVRVNSILDVLRMVYDAKGMSQEEYEAQVVRDKHELVEEFWWVSRVLEFYPESKGKVTLSGLVDTLGRQVPRLYSIASSSLTEPGTVTLCVGLRYVRGSLFEIHEGLCSGHLHSLQAGDTVFVMPRLAAFRLPEAHAAPVIMIGTGTGIAPFMAFAEERRHLRVEESAQLGQAQIYFGCRNKKEVLGEATFKAALTGGSISSYNVALSREPGVCKTYVSDVITENWMEVWKALQDPGCHCYVCGDGNMAGSVDQALVKCVQASGMSRAKAAQYVESMRVDGRFNLDVWGTVARPAAERRKDSKRSNNLAQQWLNNVLRGEDEE